MEIAALLFMLIAGGGLAIFVLFVINMLTKEAERAEGLTRAAPQRDSVAASLLAHVLAMGGTKDDEALRQVRRGTGLAASVTRGIDVANWAESYARVASPKERSDLLEWAVQLVAAAGRPVPVRQYAALLDLSFGLGFQTDALARLRELYGFDYVDHAKEGRSRDAEGAGSGPLYVRTPRVREDLLRTLGFEEQGAAPTRQELSTAYRRLVLQHHPDRFHGASNETRDRAAARFIEITRAYEELVRVVESDG